LIKAQSEKNKIRLWKRKGNHWRYKDQVRWTPFSKQSPHIYYINYKGMGHLTIRMKANVEVRNALNEIEAVLKKYDSGAPFDYNFLSDDYARLFKDEERIGKLAGVFFRFGNFYQLPRHFWVGLFRCGAAHQGDWHTQSVGCINLYPLENAVTRFYMARYCLFSTCCPADLLFLK